MMRRENRVCILLLFVLLFTSCSPKTVQTVDPNPTEVPPQETVFTPPPVSDSWIALTPGRICDLSKLEKENAGKYQAIYLNDDLHSSEPPLSNEIIQKANTIFGSFAFSLDTAYHNHQRYFTDTDYSSKGRIKTQEVKGVITTTTNFWNETSGFISFLNQANLETSHILGMNQDKSKEPYYFIPFHSFSDRTSPYPDMAVHSQNKKWETDTYLLHWMNDTEFTILGALSFQDGTEPEPFLEKAPERIFDVLDNWVFWCITDSAKEHYLFGNVTKNFGGKKVLKRYEHSATNVEEEWVIEGGINKTFPFMAKFTSDWKFLWAKRWDLKQNNMFLHEVLPQKDGFILCGLLPQRKGLWIGKINDRGEFQFLTTHATSPDELIVPTSLTEDPLGNYFVTGQMLNIVSKDSTKREYSNCFTRDSSVNMFLASFDPTGNLRFARKYGTTGQIRIKIDPENPLKEGPFEETNTFYDILDMVLPLEDGSCLLAGKLFNTFVLAKTDKNAHLKGAEEFSKVVEMKTQIVQLPISSEPLTVLLRPSEKYPKPITARIKSVTKLKETEKSPLTVVRSVSLLGWTVKKLNLFWTLDHVMLFPD